MKVCTLLAFITFVIIYLRTFDRGYLRSYLRSFVFYTFVRTMKVFYIPYTKVVFMYFGHYFIFGHYCF